MWELARRQLGLITRGQALQLVTKWELQRLLADGHLIVRRRGVFAARGAPHTYAQEILAAVLAAGELAWASHRTAARLWDLRVPSPEAIDVLTLPNRRLRLEGVDHHRNQSLATGDLGRAGAVPVTSVAKTLVDCVPWLPGRHLTRAIDDARRKKLVTYGQVEQAWQELDRGRATGRHKVVPLRPVVADRHHEGGSDLELEFARPFAGRGCRCPSSSIPCSSPVVGASSTTPIRPRRRSTSSSTGSPSMA